MQVPGRKTCSLKRIREANGLALRRMTESEPVLFDVQRALYAIPGMRRRLLLHAGPPVVWRNMCMPMKTAVAGAIVFEGWAKDLEHALAFAASGQVEFSATHHHGAVAPMAGVISPSMQVLCVKNMSFGNTAYCNLNEGLGRVLRFGAYGEDVLDNLRWVNEWVGPILKAAIHMSGPVPLKPMMVEAMRRGDECHNRHVAGNKIFIDFLRPYLIRMALAKPKVNRVLEFIENNYYSFLNVCLAASKATADAASGIPCSTVVCALSRNGRQTGIRISGLGDMWLTIQAPVPNGRFFSGYGKKDACKDMGDSTITETVGLGAFAMAAAPEIVSYLGGSSDDVIRFSQQMYSITSGEHRDFRIGLLGGRGTPLGIDIMKVVETGITPIINTGIAHKDGGIGQIGAGYVNAPMGCFEEALDIYEGTYGRI